MAQNDSFEDLMARLQAGDATAADEVFNRYITRLTALARKSLGTRLQPKVDPEDITQSVFKSFFRRQTREDSLQVEDWDSLWKILAVITLRKCGHCVEYFLSARRNLQREVVCAPQESDSGQAWEALTREPSPSEAAMLAETIERIMNTLKERDRPILVLSLQGYSLREISAEIGRSERTVYRIMAHVRHQLELQGVNGQP